jgi:hypothetical protein
LLDHVLNRLVPGIMLPRRRPTAISISTASAGSPENWRHRSGPCGLLPGPGSRMLSNFKPPCRPRAISYFPPDSDPGPGIGRSALAERCQLRRSIGLLNSLTTIARCADSILIGLGPITGHI